MNDMMSILILVLFAAFLVTGWTLCVRIYTKKELIKHQKEWDELAEKIEDLEERSEAYLRYCSSLQPKPVIGKCYPAFRHQRWRKNENGRSV